MGAAWNMRHNCRLLEKSPDARNTSAPPGWIHVLDSTLARYAEASRLTLEGTDKRYKPAEALMFLLFRHLKTPGTPPQSCIWGNSLPGRL